MKGIHYLSDPLRNRQQNGIRHARGIFGETPVRKQGFEGAGTGRASLPTYKPSPPAEAGRERRTEGEEPQATGCSAVLRKSWPGRWGPWRLNFPIRRVPKSSLGGNHVAPGTPAVPLLCPCRAPAVLSHCPEAAGGGGCLASCPLGGRGVAVEAVSLLCCLPLALLSPSEPHPGEGGT